jgi:hypothetical protein
MEPPLLLHNEGGRHKFVDVSGQSGAVFQQRWASRGLASGDFENNGKISVVITTNDGPAYFLENETTSTGHWITLRLRGTRSNRDAIGAVVKLTVDSGPQWQTVTTAGSYESSSDKRLHFGLGSSTAIKEIEVRWPSGAVQKMQNVGADRFLDIVEPSTGDAH